MIANNNHFSKRHKWAEHLLVKMVDGVICVEPRVEVFFQKRYGKGYYFPIIRDEKLLRDKLPELRIISQKYIREYDLADKTVFLFVGRLVVLKNVSTLIQSFLDANLTNAKLVIVGDGECRKELEEKAAGSDNIVFVGRIEGDELYAWYDASDIFVLPSTQEAFGAVTNEALIMGCKVLVSEITGSSCLVNKGVNGEIFNPYSGDELTRLLKLYNKKIERNTEDNKENLMEKTFNEYYEGLRDSLFQELYR